MTKETIPKEQKWNLFPAAHPCLPPLPTPPPQLPSHFKTWSENRSLLWNKCQIHSDILCKETKHSSVGKEEGCRRSYIFHQAPLGYLDHNVDVQLSKHKFKAKENSSCQNPLTLSAPSFNHSEQSNLFSSPHFQYSDKGNYWHSACARQ